MESVEESFMVEPPMTRLTLLARLKNGTDADAWREFVRLYGPVVYGFARKQGLNDSDAAELMQQVLRSVTLNPRTASEESEPGAFHDWLFKLTRDRLKELHSAGKHRSPIAYDRNSPVDTVSDREKDPVWDMEFQRQFVVKAMDRVKHEFQPSTWQAFWKTAVDKHPAHTVGLEFKMTTGAVCVAKSRVLARLRQEVHRLQTEAEIW
jgi:RNA polymerase sigma-70 factor (ECF subfamily)